MTPRGGACLGNAPDRVWLTVLRVGGERAFRRRLLEMGVLPGRRVRVVGRAPLGDPLTIETEHNRLSIRRREADAIEVTE